MTRYYFSAGGTSYEADVLGYSIILLKYNDIQQRVRYCDCNSKTSVRMEHCLMIFYLGLSSYFMQETIWTSLCSICIMFRLVHKQQGYQGNKITEFNIDFWSKGFLLCIHLHGSNKLRETTFLIGGSVPEKGVVLDIFSSNDK